MPCFYWYVAVNKCWPVDLENFKLACGTWNKMSSKYSSPALSFPFFFSDRMTKNSQRDYGEFPNRVSAITNSCKTITIEQKLFLFPPIKCTLATDIKANHLIWFAFKITKCSVMLIWTNILIRIVRLLLNIRQTPQYILHALE